MSTPYDQDYSPPAPVLPVELAFPDEAPRLGPFLALVDTGADGSFVPTSYLEQLDIPVSYQTRVRLMFGRARSVNVYTLDLIVGSRRLSSVDVVGDDEGQEILWGRNIINQLILLLDGLRAETDLLDQRPRV